jgi:hypothetical protein
MAVGTCRIEAIRERAGARAGPHQLAPVRDQPGNRTVVIPAASPASAVMVVAGLALKNS